MKKVICIVLMLWMALVFTGCMTGEDQYTMNEDGSGESHSTLVMNKAMVDEALKTYGMTIADMGIDSYRTEMIDGVESYVVEENMTFSSPTELQEALEASGAKDVYISKDMLRFAYGAELSAEDLEMINEAGIEISDALKVKIVINMPKEIVRTTGRLSEDKKSVTYEIAGNALYDRHLIFASMVTDTQKPTVKGFTTKKTYDKAITVTTSDITGIKSAQYKKNKGKYNTLAQNKKFTTNGKYTVVVTDYFDNKTTKTFAIKDTKKPTVSGVKAGKTYKNSRTIKFSDNCGVKKATLNGKTIKSGKKVSKKGNYKLIVTDVNGLKTTVTFKIKG